MKRVICVAVLVAGVSSPAMGDVYVVGTKTKEKEAAATKEIFGRPKEAGSEYGEVAWSRLPGGVALSSKKTEKSVPARRPRKLPADDETGTFGGPWPARPMSVETLKYLTTEGVVPNIRQELRGMKENTWLESYKDDEPLPDGEKLTIVTRCEIGNARAWMQELNIEVPGSRETPDSDFSWLHIYYGEGEAPEYVVPARQCATPGTFLQEEEGCFIHFNRVHYQKVLEYAKKFELWHPDEARRCFAYREWKPRNKTEPPAWLSSPWADPSDPLKDEKNGKKRPWYYRRPPKRSN